MKARQNWKKNKKSTAGLRKILTALAKIYAVIGCRFPSLISECNEVERCRVELHNIVADLYLGERPAAIDNDYYRPMTALKAALDKLRRGMERIEKGVLP